VVGAHDHNHGTSRIEVKFYHIYPGYESKSLLNDIMLLQVNDSARFFKAKIFNSYYMLYKIRRQVVIIFWLIDVCSNYKVLAPSIPIILIK